jgi:hypothetical protein
MSDGNGNGKGKSRAPPQEAEEATSSNEPSNSQSLSSRITASATGLTRSAFTAPTAIELRNQATTALTNSGKGQSIGSNSNGGSAWAESSKTAQQAIHGQASGVGSAGLRTGHHEQHIQQSENEFSSFLDAIDSFTPSENLGAAPGRGLEDVLEEDAWERSQSSHLHNWRAPERTVAEQEARDGEEVLAILSSPAGLEQLDAPLEDQDDDWGLSQEQLMQIRAMAREIFHPAEPHASVATDHPLNLRPSFEGEMMEAREHWREQWEGVLTRYTDEVWGGLLPLVKQARQEIEEMGSEGSVKEKPTALRRLESILGHLQKR